MGQQLACLDFENNKSEVHTNKPKSKEKIQIEQQQVVKPQMEQQQIKQPQIDQKSYNEPTEPPEQEEQQDLNGNKKIGDDWDDDNWDDDDNMGDIVDIDTDKQLLTRNDSLPPVLGAHISHNKLDILDEPHAELAQYTICKDSDRPKNFISPEKDYGGLVLYQYDGETEWKLNGIDCKIGLILIKDSANLPESSVGQIHGGIYKHFFNESVNEKIVASGFAYYNKKWVFKSRAFNLKTNPNEHIMRDSEIEWLKKALQNWCDDGVEITNVSPSLNVYFQEKGPYVPVTKK